MHSPFISEFAGENLDDSNDFEYEDNVADFGFDDEDDNDNVVDILGPEDYEGEHDAPGGDRDEPSSKRHRSGSLSATRVA